MNNKTEQALTDELIDQIESAARASFRRHQSSIKGQILTAADNYDWHLLHAAYQAGIHAMRAQLAEAQRDAARYRTLRSLWFQFGTMANIRTEPGISLHRINMAGDLHTLDAAIDAAKGGSNA